MTTHRGANLVQRLWTSAILNGRSSHLGKVWVALHIAASLTDEVWLMSNCVVLTASSHRQAAG
jgi:hypothetical protein